MRALYYFDTKSNLKLVQYAANGDLHLQEDYLFTPFRKNKKGFATFNLNYGPESCLDPNCQRHARAKPEDLRVIVMGLKEQSKNCD